MKATASNNYGRGWWLTFEDGHRCWVLGLSAQERRVEEAKHGKLKERKAA